MSAALLLVGLAQAATPHEVLCQELRSKRPDVARVAALGPADAAAPCVYEEEVWHRDRASAEWVIVGVLTGGIGFLLPDFAASGTTSIETHQALPLELALAWKDAALVRAVIAAGADPEARLTFDDPPLERAIEGATVTGDPAVVAALLEAGAKPASLDEAMFGSGLTAVYRGPLYPVLRQHGMDLGLRDVMGRPVLLCAVEEGDAALVARLLAEGASVTATDGFGHSAVELAITEGHPELVGALLDAGASPEVGDPAPLVAAISRGDVATADLLVARGASLRPTMSWNRTLLQVAAYGGSVPAVQWALAHGFAVDEVAEDGTALTDAAEAGHVPVIQVLLAAGANPGGGGERGDPVVRAAAWEHPEAVEVLIQAFPEVDGARRPRAEARDRAIFAAVARNRVAMVGRLVGKAALPTADAAGRTPMDVAAEAGSWEVVEWLQSRGVSIDTPDARGHTLLARALLDGDVWDASDLVGHGASIARAGGAGIIPELAAADEPRSIRWLREKGVVPDAATARAAVAAAMRADAEGAFAELVSGGAPVGGALADGSTLAHLAITHRDFLAPLAAAGAPLDRPDASGRTPLAVALAGGDADTALFLLAHGADPRAADPDPLQVAVDLRSTALLEAMLGAGVTTTTPVRVELDRAYWTVRPLQAGGVPYRLAFTVDEAIAAGNVGAAELLVEDGLGTIGLPQLEVAVRADRLDAVRYLATRVGPIRPRDRHRLLRLAREQGTRWEVRGILDEARDEQRRETNPGG